MIPDLIKRLEEAREGSAELDAEIALASGLYDHMRFAEADRLSIRAVSDDVAELTVHGPRGGGVIYTEYPPKFTRSVDAALTLVPEGWRIAEMKDGIKSDRGPYCNTRLWCPANRYLGYAYPGNGATPALALCIAALKAIGAAR
jgi:hypothetical protein